jgi:DNA topoisomerase-1
MTTLVICEKPQAAEKIAKAIGEPEIIDHNGVKYFKISDVFVVPAVGHLYTLDSINGEAPIFSVEWKPTFVVSKDALFAKRYFDALKKVAKECDDFIVACDYDHEGSVIGYNIIRFICGREDAKRMKFSTLTEKELKESYKNVSKHLNFGMINSGLCRHYLDFYYGVNISRMLTDSLKKTGKVFQIMSTGRIQGPMLSILAKREREIMQFKPEPYWQIKLNWDKFNALYENRQIWNEKEANKVVSGCKGKDAVVDEVKRENRHIKPPHPFDLTSLQVEAYNLFKYSPSRTLKIAQDLYTKAYISYPRTSSQQLPERLGLKDIISDLKKQKHYEKLCEKLLSKEKLVPRDGKKKDPAHPAIYPTGIMPEELDAYEKHIYDLIVRRFLACFADAALRESVQIFLRIGKYKFESTGSRTIEKNWIEFMEKYVNFEEVNFPELKKDDKVKVKSLDKIDKETEPPNRYSQGSIVKEMEKRGLGTKATRASILQTLYNRGYIYDHSIHVSKLGLGLFEVLDKHSKTIISEKLTHEFEVDMEKVENGEVKMEAILTKAKIVVRELVDDFKQHEIDVGRELTSAVIGAREEERTLGKCEKCGGHLKIMFSRATKKRFVGCDNYPKCTNSYPLPGYGMIKKTDKTCEKCGTPIIYVFRKGKRPFKMCLDTKCETKADWGKKGGSGKKRSSRKKDQKE